jgi:alpha-tubulin suppressor-like RCC1 family protein
MRKLVAALVAASSLGACSGGVKGSGGTPAGPPPPPPAPRPVAVAAGMDFTCAVMDSGAMKCLGNNFEGHLGNGTVVTNGYPTLDPTLVVSLAGATAASSFSFDTCAVVAGGLVACWGATYYDMLGRNAPPDYTAVPILLSDITGATAVAAGSGHTCVLAGGVARCFGSAWANGSPTSSVDPVTVASTNGSTAISAGEHHTCVITGGIAECWGNDLNGALGRPTNYPGAQETAAPVTGLGPVTAIAAGADSSCAVRADTTVWCWGLNTYGQLGNGTTGGYSQEPVPTGISGAIAVAEGYDHACALLQGGVVKCWGSNACWNLGTRDVVSSATPLEVATIPGATGIEAGATHTCVVTSTGVKCWGCNHYGELGRTTKTEVPVDVPF